MRVLNFGSINFDHVYRVDHLAKQGETVPSSDYAVYAGGKGANQSVALARAGASVRHAGNIGPEGAWIKAKMAEAGVDVSAVRVLESRGGHAIVQVARDGHNAIVIYGGANLEVTPEQIAEAFEGFGKGDFLLVQNEISHVPEIIQAAKDRGMTVCFNPSPMTPEVQRYPLKMVDLMILNHGEGAALAGVGPPNQIVAALAQRYEAEVIILTLGSDGCMGRRKDRAFSAPAQPVAKVVDTTAAGDTFIGYFVAAYSRGLRLEDCAQEGTVAAAACIQRKGAMESIPLRKELPLS